MTLKGGNHQWHIRRGGGGGGGGGVITNQPVPYLFIVIHKQYVLIYFQASQRNLFQAKALS